MNNFALYSVYYDLLYSDKDYVGESDYILNLIKTYKPEAERVLELGCGTGNHAKYLCEAGLKVIGLERSADMVALAANKNIKGFEPQIADISSFSLGVKSDVAISLFHVISYQGDNESLINCFRTTNRHLNDGGFFIFDVWYGPAVYAQKPEVRIKRLYNDDVAVTRLAEPVWHSHRNIVDVNYEILVENRRDKTTDKFRETHPMRYFTIPEIEILAELTGFKVVKTEEFLTGNSPDNTTWGVCFILEKQKNV